MNKQKINLIISVTEKLYSDGCKKCLHQPNYHGLTKEEYLAFQAIIVAERLNANEEEMDYLKERAENVKETVSA